MTTLLLLVSLILNLPSISPRTTLIQACVLDPELAKHLATYDFDSACVLDPGLAKHLATSHLDPGLAKHLNDCRPRFGSLRYECQ